MATNLMVFLCLGTSHLSRLAEVWQNVLVELGNMTIVACGGAMTEFAMRTGFVVASQMMGIAGAAVKFGFMAVVNQRGFEVKLERRFDE